MDKPTENVIAFPESAIDPETALFNSMRLHISHMKDHPLVPVKRTEKYLPDGMVFGRVQWQAHQFWCLLHQEKPDLWSMSVSLNPWLIKDADPAKVELLRWTRLEDAQAMCTKDLESLELIDQIRAAIMINDLPHPTELDRRRIIRHAKARGERLRALFESGMFLSTPAISD